MSTQPPHPKRKVGRGGGRNRVQRGNSGPIQNSQSHPTQVIVPGVYSNAHFVHAAAVLKGLKVQVVVLSPHQTKYEGIFSTISPSSEIVLELAHMVEGTNTVLNKDRILDKLVIKAKDIVSLTARDVDLEYAVKSDQTQSGFLTDTDISGKKSNGQAGERELEQWNPANEPPTDLSLDGDTNGWSVEDMFKANKKHFGYESSYDKALPEYTTVLRKDDSEEFRIKQERANRLALEIEESTGFKQRVELELDDGQTEEDRFSAVQRPKARISPLVQTRSGSPKNNMQFDGNAMSSQSKYVPPHLRPNQKPPQRNYNQPSHRPHVPTGQRVPTHPQHPQNMARPTRHIGPDDRLTMQDVRVDNRQSQDVRLTSQDARIAYEPRQRSAAQVVAGTNNPQHGMVQQQAMKQREVKPESMGTSASPGPTGNMVKQPAKDIPRVPSPMIESNPHQPVTDDKKQPQKSQKQSQKMMELNEFSNNFRLQDNQSVPTNNHAATQIIESKPVQTLNPAAPLPQASQQATGQPVGQPPSQSSQTRPLPPAQQQLPSGPPPHPQAPITQVIPPQPLPQKLAQPQVLILQQQQQPPHPQPQQPAQPTRPMEEKKQEFKLNPNAKEFILNPSAKPFTPNSLRSKVPPSKTPTPPRPHSRQSQSPTLHPTSMQIPLVPGGPPYTVIPQMQQVVYTQMPPLHKKYPKNIPATNIPQPQRAQQSGDTGQGMNASTATGPPLIASPHFSMASYGQVPGGHPGQIIPGPPMMPHQAMPFVMQPPKLPYRPGQPNPMANVQSQAAHLHPLQDANTPVFGPNQVYPGQQQPSIYSHHHQSAQQGGQQHPQAPHPQMGHHPHGPPQPVQPNQHHPGQPQGHRPSPSPVQHPIQSPSQPTQPGLLLYNMPQHSQPIPTHAPQSQQFTTVLMHQQQQQPQPYSATSHNITNMTTVHGTPHPHPHVQPNLMYSGAPHSHTVMLPHGGNIQYVPQQQGGQGQHPPIQAYQQSN